MVTPETTHFSVIEDLLMSGVGIKRLLMACAMGGAVGVEREYRHKDSGLRTNMLICMGSALFTIMSPILAGVGGQNRGQVASNIVQGIGFLGAGLILHTKNRITGLTSAATVFVVAAIGMTCGAGLFLEALVATIIVLLSLQVVGLLEFQIGWHRFPVLYEVRAEVGATLSKETVGVARAEALAEESEAAKRRMFTAILKALDDSRLRLNVIDHENVAGLERVTFLVVTTRRVHDRLERELRESDATDQVVVHKDVEEE